MKSSQTQNPKQITNAVAAAALNMLPTLPLSGSYIQLS
jgi:hypothetical protein